MIVANIILGLVGLGLVSWSGYNAFCGFFKQDVEFPLGTILFGLLGSLLIKTKRLYGGGAIVGGVFWFIFMMFGGLILLAAIFME